MTIMASLLITRWIICGWNDGGRTSSRLRLLNSAHCSYSLLILYLVCGFVCGSESSRLPVSPAGGDVLLFERLVKVISKNRLAMNADTVTGQSINYDSDTLQQAFNSTLRDKMLELMQKYDKMKSKSPSSSSDSRDSPFITAPSNHDGSICFLLAQGSNQCDHWKAFVFQYLFPWVLCLAILGNALTLAVYRSRYLKGAASVLLLAVKAQANLAFVCSLSMEMIHYFVTDDPLFQDIYWKSRPYTLFLANYFDSLAVWCTLVITLETYICVSFPLSFRRWSNRRTIYVVIVCLMTASGLLHVAYPITRDVEKLPSCPVQYRYRMVIRDGWIYYDYERIYFVLHALAVISLPALLMAIFSILIGYNFNRKPMGQRFSERRRCVLRITFTTTVCSLILQAPGLVVFASAAIRGSNLENNYSLCTMNVITTFLTILNSAAPFLVYVCLNDTFRRLLFVQLCSRFSSCPFVRPWCTRTYEAGIGRVPLRELTEPEPSHCALTPESNFNLRHSSSSLLQWNTGNEVENGGGSNDQNRSPANGAHVRIVSPVVQQKRVLIRNSSPILMNQTKPARCTEPVKIVVEEVL